MIENLIMFLIYVCVLAGVIYLVLWVIQSVAGIGIPPKVVQIVWVIFILIVLLLLIRMVVPSISGHKVF